MRGTTIPTPQLKVLGKPKQKNAESSSTHIAQEPLCYFLCFAFENFLGFQLQVTHTVSFFYIHKCLGKNAIRPICL